MKITKNLLPDSIVELVVEESVENVAKYRNKAIAHLEKNADIKGFRKWTKIPENILIRQYGEEYINKMVIDFAIDGLYRKALTKEKIMPVAQAEINEIVNESPLKFKIHIEVFPTIEIDKKYKPGFFLQNRYFIDCVISNKQVNFPGSDLNDYYITMLIASKINNGINYKWLKLQ